MNDSSGLAAARRVALAVAESERMSLWDSRPNFNPFALVESWSKDSQKARRLELCLTREAAAAWSVIDPSASSRMRPPQHGSHRASLEISCRGLKLHQLEEKLASAAAQEQTKLVLTLAFRSCQNPSLALCIHDEGASWLGCHNAGPLKLKLDLFS
jgi:hypothetical protein